MEDARARMITLYYGRHIEMFKKEGRLAECAAFDALADQCFEQEKQGASQNSVYRLDVEGDSRPVHREGIKGCLHAALGRCRFGPKKSVDESPGKGLVEAIQRGEKAVDWLEQTVGMGHDYPKTAADYPSSCTAFEAFDPLSSERICGALDRSQDMTSVDVLMRGEAGDGAIRALEYDIVRGEKREVASRWLLEEGGGSFASMGMSMLG